MLKGYRGSISGDGPRLNKDDINLQNKSLSINGFSIYKYTRALQNVYRIKSINSNCRFNCNSNDVIISIDNNIVSLWSYKEIMTYISEITITTIITEEYYTWKRKQNSPNKNPDLSISLSVPQSGDFVYYFFIKPTT